MPDLPDYLADQILSLKVTAAAHIAADPDADLAESTIALTVAIHQLLVDAGRLTDPALPARVIAALPHPSPEGIFSPAERDRFAAFLRAELNQNKPS